MSHDIAAYISASDGVVAGGDKTDERDGDKDDTRGAKQDNKEQPIVRTTEQQDRPLPGEQGMGEERREVDGGGEAIQEAPLGGCTQELAFSSGRKLPYGLLTHEQPQTHLLPYDSLLGMFRKRKKAEVERGGEEGGDEKGCGVNKAQQCDEDDERGSKCRFDVMVPLCPWELRGMCKDATCTFQHLELRPDLKPNMPTNGMDVADNGDERTTGVPPYVAMEPGLPHQGGTGIVHGKMSDNTHKIKKREFDPHATAEAA